MATKEDYAGSILYGASTVELTDAAATAVLTFDTDGVQTLLIDVTSDKGCTVDVVRYLDQDGGIEGKPSTQGVVADGGPSNSFKYPDVGCKAVKVTITKTEAGTTSGFGVFVRGQAG